MKKPSRGEAGFTLIELLVVLVILGVIGGVVTAGILAAFRSSVETSTRIDARQELELSSQQIARVLRSAEKLLIVSGDESFQVGAELRTASADDDVYFGVVEADGTPVLVQCPGTVSCLTDEDAPQRQLITIVANDPDDPDGAVFLYRDRQGNVLDPENAGEARLVTVRLERELSGDRNPVVVETSVAIRRARYVGSDS